MVTRSPNSTATGAPRNSGDDDRYVQTDDIRKAVDGHEPEVLKAIGIDWPGGSKHINCPYPGHDDKHPSWRWHDQDRKAYCTCRKAHDIFDVVSSMTGADFAAAKIRVAEAIGRGDLIQTPGKYQAMDAASLLEAPVENRDDHLPVAYLAFRLGVDEVEVPKPRTRMIGIKALGYFDPPANGQGKSKHVGDFPCAVFETLDVHDRRHAHRIYLAPGGAGKADLGKRADGEERDPKKSAKVNKGDRITGRAVIWGDLAQAPHLIVAEGIETAAAVALAWWVEIQAGTVAVVSAIDANGIEAFRPWPATRIITVAADRDEGVNEDGRQRDRRGERAACKLAMARQDQVEVRIALPGEPDTKTDWLDVFRADGAAAVRAGVDGAKPFVQTDAGGNNDRGGQNGQKQDHRASGAEAPPEPWPDPLPLVPPAEEPRLYPIDALPPTLRNACVAYQAFGQQPMALVACSALAAASLATQGLADVERAPGLAGPIGLYVLVVAQSGERKTSADKRMSKPIRMWELEKKASMKPDVDAARTRMAAFEAERDGLLAKIKAGAGRPGGKSDKVKVEGADLDKLKHDLEEMETRAPVAPIVPELFHEDVTPEKMAEELALGWPSASLWSDEAGLVVGSHGMGRDSIMRYLALINRFWDGEPFSRKRSTTKSFTVKGRRLTTCLMMQETILRQLLAAGDGVSRGSGFMARFLMAWPVSTMGGRFYRPGDPDHPALAAYDARLRALLDMPLPVEGEGMELKPPVLSLSDAAHAMWIKVHDDVERSLARHGEFFDVKDVAAKTADNAARIAGVFHVLEHGPVGDVVGETMKQAARLALWHLHEAKRIIGAIDIPEVLADAKVLLEWLLSQDGDVAPKAVLHRGPSRLRDRGRRDEAIETLVETNHLIRKRVGRTQEILEINPKLRGQP